MSRNADQKAGLDFEREFARKLGARLTPGSGNQWFARMDVSDAAVLWSLKSTQFKSFPLSIDLMREVVTATDGISGTGAIPGVAIRLSHRRNPVDLVVLRAEDFRRIVTEDIRYVQPDKTEQKRRQARQPILLRDQEEPSQ